MPADWLPAPADFSPAPGMVYVFRLALDLPAERMEALGSLLSPEERARAARYIPESSRRTLIAAHGQMREVLGAALRQTPQSLVFAAHPRGKPYLQESPLRFNLSHSGGLALLALVLDQEIGVDIENTTRRVDFNALARRFFAPSEAAAFEALPPEEQRAAFFRCWTRKEAYIKARGDGLAIPLDSFTVTFAAGDAPRISEPGWTLAHLDPGPGYTGALVCAGAPRQISCWQWPVSRPAPGV